MSEKLRKLKDKASRLNAEGKLKAALELYTDIVAEDPGEVQCRLKIGDIQRKLGHRAASVEAYAAVARHYAEDGLLLKAIAVCKMILGVDGSHTETQAMLAELYGRRRAPAHGLPSQRPAASASRVTAEALGIAASPGVGDYRLLDLEGAGASTEAPRLVRGTPVVQGVAVVAGTPATPPTQAAADVRAAWPASGDAPSWSASSAPPAWPVAAAGARAPSPGPAPSVPGVAWPVSGAASKPQTLAGAGAWPVAPSAPAGGELELLPGAGLEDSQLDISVGEIEDEPPAAAPVGRPKLEPIELDLDEDHQGELSALLDELGGEAAADEGEEAELGALGRPHIPLFSDLPREAFISLLVHMQMRELGPGEVVIREGEIGHSFFVLASGRVGVRRRAHDGEEVLLAELTDGAFFGEMALLQDGARTASVVVEEDSQIFEISRQVLGQVVAEYPSVDQILRNFCRQRLLSTTMATHPLFKPFGAEERRRIMALFKSRSFDAGDVLLREAERGTGLFLVLHGTLQVTRTQDGTPRILAELGAGDLFGEMSLLTQQPTVASVTALTDCLVLRLSRQDFSELIMTHPQILELVSGISDERATLNDVLLGDRHHQVAGAVLV